MDTCKTYMDIDEDVSYITKINDFIVLVTVNTPPKRNTLKTVYQLSCKKKYQLTFARPQYFTRDD